MPWEPQTQWPQQRLLCALKGAKNCFCFCRELLDLREKTPTVELVGRSETGRRIPRENELMGLSQKKPVIVTVHRYFIMSDKMAFIFCILV